MKKSFLIAIIAIAVLTAGIYFLIPSTSRLLHILPVNCKPAAAQRLVAEKKRWIRWWPGEPQDNNIFRFQDSRFRIDGMLFNGLSVTVFRGDDSLSGELSLNPASPENINLVWTASDSLPLNPLGRVTTYFNSIKTDKIIALLLDSMKSKLESNESVYGFTPQMAKVTDEFMISVKEQSNHYPTVPEIYQIIDGIRNYIGRIGGTEKSPPMLNVSRFSDSLYQVMVAIPTTTELRGEGKFLLKKMVLGNIVVGEIRGGPYTILEAEKEMEHYVRDNGKTSPAIPYQSLLTDRLKEQDTTKWVTRIYYPVFF